MERRLGQQATETEPSLAGHLTVGVLPGAVAGTAVGGWLGYDRSTNLGGPGGRVLGPDEVRDDDFLDEDALIGGLVGAGLGGSLGVVIYRAKVR